MDTIIGTRTRFEIKLYQALNFKFGETQYLSSDIFSGILYMLILLHKNMKYSNKY